MKKLYETPAVVIKGYDISENFTLSAVVAPGDDLVDTKDDGSFDMSGGPA